jgi:ribosome-binding ATPase YchF (GTP1/OBG family)
MSDADRDDQADELEALQSIFFEENELQIIESTSPTQLKVLAFTFLNSPVYLLITFPPTYPSTVPPTITLQHNLNMLQFPSRVERTAIKVAMNSCSDELGNPSVMGAVYAVRTWEEDGGVEEAMNVVVEDECEEDDDVVEETILIVPPTEFIPFTETSEFERPDLLDAESIGLSLACDRILSNSPIDYSCAKGGHLNVTIGLIGKPSAGKSTFFNAATAFSRQSGGGEGAKIGAAPFTTIDPNLGWAFVPMPDDAELKGAPAGSEFGRDSNGRRLLPLLVKDVAGLVPGAYAGRGKGNKFLDDLTEACAFVQITDSSGRSDVNGNVLDEDGAEGVNVMDDVGWIRRELVMWIVNNVLPKFPTVVKKGQVRLHELFTGYRQSKHIMEQVLFLLQANGAEVVEFDTWRRVDVHKLVSCFLAYRFPSVVCLNKMDKQGALEKIAEVKKNLPLHGCFDCEGVCAQDEMGAVKMAMEGKEGVACDDNVWKVLTKALAFTNAVYVFPVVDLATCASLPVKRAGGAGDMSDGHLKSILARGGQKGEDCRGVCEVCLTMKDGSTVEDLYEHLKNLGAVKGMFVRAEGMEDVGGKSRQLKKDELLGPTNRVIRICTNKNRAHETGGEVVRNKDANKKTHRTKS